MRYSMAVFVACAVMALPHARAETLKPVHGGVQIDAGGMGHFTLSYPHLLSKGAKQTFKPVDTTLQGASATLKYANDATLVLKVSGGEIDLRFSKVPAACDSFKMEMEIGQHFNQGGTWRVGPGEKTPLPAEKPPKPHLYQGHAQSFELASVDGATLALSLPPHAYQQLQDNREWGWKMNHWSFHAPLVGDSFKVSVKAVQAAGSVVLMDRFGQYTRADWPGKVKSEEELKQDALEETAYYASFKPPELDRYGGLPGSGQKLGLAKTGFFHVERKGERWYLVNPEGNAFFHLGVCSFASYQEATYWKDRESVFEWLPPHDAEWGGCYRGWEGSEVSFLLANMRRKYGAVPSVKEFTARNIDRVRAWGFNSTGAFGAGDASARAEKNFPHVSDLPLSQWSGIKPIPGITRTWDPFDPQMQKKFDENCAKSIAPKADDPLLIGYFLTNEPLYEDIPRVVPKLKGEWACKRRLVEELRAKYKTVQALNAAWNLKAESFEALIDQGLPVQTPAAGEDMQAFTALFLDELFRTATETVRKYDRNHLLLGCRLQFGTINNEQLCRIGGKYMDIWSFNYYTYALDRAFLERVRSWTGGKPMILSEFYWSAPSASGLPGGVKDVKTQEERGLAYRQYVEQAAAMDFIVGVEWYTLYDMAFTGVGYSKIGGENANDGLLAMTDRPWKEMVAHMARTNHEIYAVVLGERKPFVFDDPRFKLGVPLAQSVKVLRAAGPIEIDGRAEGWPGIPAERIGSERMVQGADAGGLEATFKLCWDDAHLYLLLEVRDATPLRNEREAESLWSADCIEVFLGSEAPETDGPLRAGDRQVLLRAAPPHAKHANVYVPQADAAGIKSAAVAHVDGKGYVVEASIPFALLGLSAAPESGRTLRFDLGIDDSADGRIRLRQLMWNGSLRNSKDRGGWGKAVLVK